MSKEPLSDLCSIMKHPDRKVMPSECPKDATYIKTGNEGGSSELHPITPFPLVIEGGTGDDHVTVVGEAKNPVLIDGGSGNDSVLVQSDGAAPAEGKGGLIMGPSPAAQGSEGQTMQNDGAWLLAQLTPTGLTFLGALLIAFATIGLLGWRALTGSGAGRYR